MRIPSLRKQYLGDINEIIRKKRAEMNMELEKKLAEAFAKRGNKDGIDI